MQKKPTEAGYQDATKETNNEKVKPFKLPAELWKL